MDTVVAIDSFYDQTPGGDYIQALKDSELYYISFHELDYLFDHFPEFNFVGRMLTNKYRNPRHLTPALLMIPKKARHYRASRR
ncbi:MAG TPA: hypothetical protein VGQ51_17260 [Puia sp.]|jgi:hypothetical protein|nr:hypothetical protein [Puia sp.]